MMSARNLQHAAQSLLQAYGSGSILERSRILAALRPRPGDYDLVFTADSVAHARAGYHRMWLDLPLPQVAADQTEVSVTSVSTVELRHESPTARKFPRGYRQIADRLQPGRTWMCWEHVAPGATHGTMYDGLVDVNGRFVWLPKPWRFLPSQVARSLEHWAA